MGDSSALNRIYDFADRQHRLRTTLNENQFIVPSYTHYGGSAGFQDYGVNGIRVKSKLIHIWRNMFLWNDEIEEIETPIIMPYELLKASGHVDRFTDYVVYDDDKRCFRADHVVKEYFKSNNMNHLVGRVDGMSMAELEDNINKYNMLNQDKPVSVTTKNLMFPILSNHVTTPDFLRPELAQGLFVNFKVYHQYSQRNVPFGLCQVGKSYRDEITTKQFTRMREFTQAEIEYFVDPKDKYHPLYDTVKDQVIKFVPNFAQTSENYDPMIMTVDAAHQLGMISNQVMAYFLGRIYQFALAIGLSEDKIRFRQHMSSEMAHYAAECWDLETFVNNDWLECIGCADRGSYDLKAHSSRSSLMLKRELDQPIHTSELRIEMNKRLIGAAFKEATPDIVSYFDGLTEDQIKDIKKTFDEGSTSLRISVDEEVEYILSDKMISVKEIKTTITSKDYYPCVIEPSFGIDRLLYSIFEHNFWLRANDDDKRIVLSLPKSLVPYDIAIFQLYNRPDMMSMAKEIKKLLLDNRISCYIDNSRTSIGKRYSRLDEIGVKYAITVDPGSVDAESTNYKKVTIRERDSMKQIYVHIDEIINTLQTLT